MTAVVDVALLLGSVVMLATSGLALHVMWRASRDQWRRTPPDRKPRAAAAGAATAVLIGVALALSIAAPWGPDSVVYVLVVGFGGLVLTLLVVVAVGAIQETRQARRHLRGE